DAVAPVAGPQPLGLELVERHDADEPRLAILDAALCRLLDGAQGTAAADPAGHAAIGGEDRLGAGLGRARGDRAPDSREREGLAFRGQLFRQFGYVVACGHRSLLKPAPDAAPGRRGSADCAPAQTDPHAAGGPACPPPP